MDRGSIGCIIPSKEENSSFILKQRLKWRARYSYSSGLLGRLLLHAELPFWNTEHWNPTKHIQIGAFLTYSCPSTASLTPVRSHTHWNTQIRMHTGSSPGKHCNLWASSGLQKRRMPWRVVWIFHHQQLSEKTKSKLPSFYQPNRTFISLHNACSYQSLAPNKTD